MKPGWIDDPSSPEFRAAVEVCCAAGVPPTPDHLVAAYDTFMGRSRAAGLVLRDVAQTLIAWVRRIASR